jgi:hypothetical protein
VIILSRENLYQGVKQFINQNINCPSQVVLRQRYPDPDRCRSEQELQQK